MSYILKHKTRNDNWRYVGISTTSNDGAEFCNSTTVEFETSEERPYLFTDLSVAEKVLSGDYNVEWYNSSVDTPMLSDYTKKEIMKNYEIVKLVPEIIE